MNCYEFQDNISTYLDNEFPTSKTKLFKEHMEKCYSCSNALKGVKHSIAVMNGLETVSTSSSFNDKLKSRLKEINSKPAVNKKRYISSNRVFGYSPTYAFLTAAAVIAIVVLSVSLFQDSNTGMPSDLPTLTTQDFLNKPMKIPETIQTKNADIWGEFDGNLEVSNTLTIQEKGTVKGITKYQALQIKLGGKLQGEVETIEKPKIKAVPNPLDSKNTNKAG